MIHGPQNDEKTAPVSRQGAHAHSSGKLEEQCPNSLAKISFDYHKSLNLAKGCEFSVSQFQLLELKDWHTISTFWLLLSSKALFFFPRKLRLSTKLYSSQFQSRSFKVLPNNFKSSKPGNQELER